MIRLAGWLGRHACRIWLTRPLSDGVAGCRWRLVGVRWEPSCDAPPISIPAGQRGDHAAMMRALAQPANRAERRHQQKGKRRG